VNVRVIAATKKNLVDELQKGTFREDLFYRLSVIPLFIPPLRKRGNDKLALFNYFLKVKAQKLSKPIPSVSGELLSQISVYNWPGNVRELENYVENIVNFNGHSSFSITNPIVDQQKEKEVLSDQNQAIENGMHNDDFANMTLEEIEKITIKECFDKLEGNITQVSRKLGISRTTLYSKMKKYNLQEN
jgi:transcriptional regulator with PAS, ATPase and Fis domain